MHYARCCDHVPLDLLGMMDYMEQSPGLASNAG